MKDGLTMSTQKQLDYREIRSLPKFILDVSKDAGRYRYIAARERRGFNVLYSYRDEHVKLVTIAGLLSNARGIMEEYVQTGAFPRVLILDDLAVYGRGITKSVYQFRMLVHDLLEEAYPDRFSEDLFASDFQQGVDVWVYAASPKAGLLETGPFSFRIFSGAFSSMRSIHDMSLQFSQLLAGLPIANTSFSFSARCHRAWKPLLTSSKGVPPGWSRVSLDYEGDQAVVYLKPCGGPAVWRFKTLRFFPGQDDEGIQITSFPLLGALDGHAARPLCQAGMRLAGEYGFPEIGRLLEETHPYLQPVKAQLLVFLVSMLDFYDFCEDLLNEAEYKGMLGQSTCDLGKIACNFGSMDMVPEFRRIAFDRLLRRILGRILEPFLNGAGMPLLHRPSEDFAGLDIRMEGSGQGDACVDKVARYIWAMGIQDEKAALEVADQPYWFEALDYRESGSSLEHILEDLDADAPDPGTACGRFAALLVTMDRGLEGPLVSIGEDGGAQVLLKVGELSTFYPMKKHAAWIPALARVEEFYYLQYYTKREAVSAFLKKYKGYDEDLLQIYKYGQTFADWNFPNLVRFSGDMEEAAMHSKQAEEFLGLPDGGGI